MNSPIESRRLLSPTMWVALLIVVGTGLRLWAAAATGLGYGEANYFATAMHPDWSYFDQPPLSLWAAYLSAKLLGTHPLALRLPFVLMFAGTTWLVYSLGRRLYGERAGLWAAVLLNVSFVFTMSTALFLQPDGPLMLLWLACTGCLVRIFLDTPRHPTRWWLATGALVGLAMLSKYHAIFIAAAAFVFMLTSRPHRRWLGTSGPYLALAVAVIVSSPVLIWNAQHGWISLLWQGARGTKSAGLRLDWLGRNIVGQALYVMPWLWAPLLWQLVACLRKGPRCPTAWLIGLLSVGPVIVFTAISAYAPIGLHFHWQTPGYLLLLLPLGAAIAAAMDRVPSGVPCRSVALSATRRHASAEHAAAVGHAGSSAERKVLHAARGEATPAAPEAQVRHAEPAPSGQDLHALPSSGASAEHAGASTLRHGTPLRHGTHVTLVRIWLVASIVLGVVAAGLLTSHAATGWARKAGIVEGGAAMGQKTDVTLEMLDWGELAACLRDKGLLNRPNTFLFTNRWFQSGKVSHAVGAGMDVLCFHDDPRSFAFFAPPWRWRGQDGVLIGTAEFLKWPLETFGPHFASIEPLGELDIHRAGLAEERLKLYLCKRFDGNFPMPYGPGRDR